MKWKVIWRKKRLPPKWYDISRKLRVPILQPYYCRQVSDCFTHLSMIKDWCQSFTQMHPSFSSGKCPVRLLQFQFIFMKKCSSSSNKGLKNIHLTLLSLGRLENHNKFRVSVTLRNYCNPIMMPPTSQYQHLVV